MRDSVHLALAALALVSADCGGGARVRATADAWPAVDGFLAAFEAQRADGVRGLASPTFAASMDADQGAALAQVAAEMTALLGSRRRGAAVPSESASDLLFSTSGARVLAASWPVEYEHGAATIDVRLVSPPDRTPWRVDACSIRSDAFTWELRATR